jgi:hypothetical protein
MRLAEGRKGADGACRVDLAQAGKDGARHGGGAAQDDGGTQGAVREGARERRKCRRQVAEEARKIHFGETEARGIYGAATIEEAKGLAEDGIEFMPLPVFPDDRN